MHDIFVNRISDVISLAIVADDPTEYNRDNGKLLQSVLKEDYNRIGHLTAISMTGLFVVRVFDEAGAELAATSFIVDDGSSDVNKALMAVRTSCPCTAEVPAFVTDCDYDNDTRHMLKKLSGSTDTALGMVCV